MPATLKRLRGRATRGPLTASNYRALADFRHALRRFMAFSTSEAKRAGTTPQQHQALLSIKAAPNGEALTVRELAAHLLINHNSAVELVDRLVKASLVKRETDAVDRRRVQIKLTAKADRLLERLTAAHLRELRSVGPALMEVFNQLGEIASEERPKNSSLELRAEGGGIA